MRGLDSRFLSAMRDGLENGRRKGYVGWDERWAHGKVVFPVPPMDWLKARLHQEMDELTVAIYEKDPDKILKEAADVANFAMFIADITRGE
jgi:hypothetical protein